MPTPSSLAEQVEVRSSTSELFETHRGLITQRPNKGYVSLIFSAGRQFSTRLDGVQAFLGWSFRAVCVGYSDDQCLFVAEQFRALILGWRPAGTDARFRESDDDPPVLRNDSIPEDVRYSTTLLYRLTT